MLGPLDSSLPKLLREPWLPADEACSSGFCACCVLGSATTDRHSCWTASSGGPSCTDPSVLQSPPLLSMSQCRCASEQPRNAVTCLHPLPGCSLSGAARQRPASPGQGCSAALQWQPEQQKHRSPRPGRAALAAGCGCVPPGLQQQGSSSWQGEVCKKSLGRKMAVHTLVCRVRAGHQAHRTPRRPAGLWPCDPRKKKPSSSLRFGCVLLLTNLARAQRPVQLRTASLSLIHAL